MKKRIVNKSLKRRLKVNTRAFPRQYHRYVMFPEIRLSGKWLKDIGFESGKFVLVSHENNEIRIVLESEESINI